MVDTSLITFKAIADFTNCLEYVFGKEHRFLKLYAHLINKTQISHERPILKHIEAFRIFCVTNRSSIETKEYKKFELKNITYSERVYIDMDIILSNADQETSIEIWKHLLTISALVDPTGKAKFLLKESSKKNDSGNESVFLTNIIDKVEKNVDPKANPMDAIKSIMSSGLIEDLVGGLGEGLENGNLDLGKLMGSVQSMVGNLNPEGEGTGTGEGEDPMSGLLTAMMSNMNVNENDTGNDGTQQMPDISNIMNMVNSMNKK